MTTTSGVSSTILGPTLIFASFVIHRSSVFSKCVMSQNLIIDSDPAINHDEDLERVK